MKKIFLLFAIFVLLLSCEDEGKNNNNTSILPPLISPVSGTYDVNQTITLTSQTEGSEIYYSIDGNEPNNTTLVYVSPFKLPVGNYKLKAISYKNKKYSIVSEVDYIIKDNVVSDNLTVHFKKPASWGNTVKIYYWDTTPETTEITWPGIDMTSEGNDWFTYTIRNVNAANIIFNDTAHQTGDLTRNKEGWYYNEQWYDEKPNEYQIPVISANPNSGEYFEEIDVILSSLNTEDSIYYTIDGTEPNINSEKYITPIHLNESTTIKAFGVNKINQSGEIKSFNYTLTIVNGLLVYFKKPASWGNTVKIHYWNTIPVVSGTTWPGVAMTPIENDWFMFVIEGVDSSNIVFNDGNGHQTGDLTRNKKGWYFTDNIWYDENPEKPIVAANPLPNTYSEPQTITLTSTNSTDIIYYTTDSTDPTTSSNTYSSPIRVNQSTIIKAFSVNTMGQIGEIKTFNYIIDANIDNISATITASQTTGVHPNPISVNFTIRDNKATPVKAYYTIDNSTPTVNSIVYIQGNALNGLTGANLQINETTTVKFLVIDGANNETREAFYYHIGEIQARDFREETIYFLITTRFYDGDETNNYYNRDRIKFDANGNATDPQWRGDFKGLIQKLDYIKDLGFTAIWITPPIENRSGLDYHGYHGYDWTKIDKRLESDGITYQDLINEAHARNIKIIQDVVINHSSQYGVKGKVWIPHLPIKYYVPQGSQQGLVDNGPYQGNLGDYKWEFKDDNDNPLAPEWFRERHSSDAEGIIPLTDPVTGSVLPLAGFNPNRFFGINLSDLAPLAEWYHQSGFMAGGDWENVVIQQKHLAGDCIDFATENQVVKDYLNNAINGYLDMGVDAIRLDTVKHLERGNLLEYVNNWKAHKPSIFVFGENLVKGTGWGDLGGDNAPSDLRPWWYTRLGNERGNPNSGGDSGFSVLDFSLFSTFRDNVSRGSYSGIGGILAMDWVYGDATKLVTFLQNHDVGPDNDFRDRFRGEQWQAASAYNMLWTIRGIPCLYYGEEIEFQKGKPQDIMGNSDTLDMTGRAYFGDFINNTNISATQSNALYQHIKRLNQIRSSIPALQKASMSNVNEFGNGMSFVRDYNNGESYAAIGLSVGEGNYEDKITINGVRNGTYRDAITGTEIVVKNNSITFKVKNNSMGIYVLNGPGKIGKDGKYLR